MSIDGSILSPSLADGMVVLAVLLPLAIGVICVVRAAGTWWRRALKGAIGCVVVLACQGIALVAVLLQVNQSYGLYTGWSQLLGQQAPPPRQNLVKIRRHSPVRRIPISKDNPHPEGEWSGIEVEGTDAMYSHLPVWLPPQYFEKSQSHVSFPVLYWVGGLNDTGEHANVTVPITGPAEKLIEDGQVNPFAVVFLPGRIREGQDTECTNIGGMDHQSWILDTVMPKIEKHFRVGHIRAQRFIAGYSTGGYCAANLTSKYPDRFNAGFGLAPYFHPLFDPPQSSQATPLLISENSVVNRVRSGHVPRDVRFLSVISKADRQAWSDPASKGEIDGEEFWKKARSMSQYPFMLLSQGGHTTGTYAPYVPQSLEWLGQYGL
ncbi:alpha/beta hydrolase [Acidipropionibacterium acidipropionici]|uniref:alpha/beta hydrolase n=1 Tax=Acidipropionibacterium acidipropionici TaxID=1748 RepID=UPI0004019FE8|nr:alpha/beta hydrolase-fold protein [Acidipropionibacterium acidipropionici]ALN15737.1 hypothetical protein ASQ49_11185 [Acidipropionibacterium acidipropionici]APZ08521.1 hypothetical protein BWX38_03725 [Acidipropionibacterium acidipropionici]